MTIRVTAAGPMPGFDPLRAQRIVMDELIGGARSEFGLPFLVQLPVRGPGSESVGRTAAILEQLPVELGPHGWKFADHPGRDVSRAQAFMREDLGSLAVVAHGFTGDLSVSVMGPWTLAAHLYTARGDRVLADHGAVRELTASLAQGVVDHVAAVRAQVPGLGQLTVQLDESLWGQIAAGVLPTFSGAARIKAVESDRLSAGLGGFLSILRDAGIPAVVQVGAAGVALRAVVDGGAEAAGFAVGPWNEQAWACVAEAVEAGTSLWVGLPAARVSQCAGPDISGAADAVLTPWRRIGLPVRALESVVLMPAADLSSLTEPAARDHLDTLLRVAETVAERAGNG